MLIQILIASLLICIAGGLTFYIILPATFGSAQLRKDLRRMARKFKIMLRHGSELGGYVHDTAVSFWIGYARFTHNSGTWTMTVGPVANTYMSRRTAAAATSITVIQIVPLQNSNASKGFYLTSVDIWFEYTTAAPTTLDALIWKNTLGADTAVLVAAAVPFSYDTGHDTAGERDNVDQHKMTLTLTTPVWIDNDDIYFVELTSVNAASTVLDFYGARINGTLRL